MSKMHQVHCVRERYFRDNTKKPFVTIYEGSFSKVPTEIITKFDDGMEIVTTYTDLKEAEAYYKRLSLCIDIAFEEGKDDDRTD